MSPKSFAVCFLFKYCISHQQESNKLLSLPDLSHLEQGDSGETRDRSQWGDRTRGLDTGWGGGQRHKGESPVPHPLWPSWSWSLLSCRGCTASPVSCIVLLLLGDLFASLLRISSQAIYGDFTASQTEASCCSSARDPSHMSHPCL